MGGFDKKKSILIALFVIMAIAVVGAGLMLLYKPWQTKTPSPAQQTVEQIPNPTQALPKNNPFEIETNPFKDKKTNPFR
ncbi:hypothetical protein HY358_01795 [Candidatus Roizmanbacteria bacterium]|nr:hypothetical protein [Candidatus Roizmanbacteria bacterium]